MNRFEEAPILIVDDDEGVREYLQTLLRRQGYATEAVADATTALMRLQQRHYPLALIDIKMPGIDGLTLLKQMRLAEIETQVIVLTGYGTIEGAVEAMKLGAYDYMTKPPDAVKLCLVIAKALEKAGLERQNVHLRFALEKRAAQVELIGESSAMQQVRQMIAQVAAVDSTVLILGQTGTGKELVARAIHEQSERRAELFLAINCASIPESLLESELFGHEKHAFTGAGRTKIGVFEAADRGTIFLDEISEMPTTMQASLLRVLESGEFRRVGSNHVRHTQARVIAATNRDLEAEVEAGRFRRDLFYRLNVLTIHLPPLVERGGDIPLLAKHFLMENVRRLGKRIRGFTDEAMRMLESYPWPGNVRELKNVVERAVLLCQEEWISPAELNIRVTSPAESPSSALYSEMWTLEELERYHIQRAFERNQGRREPTARQLGISVRTLYRKLRKYRIID